MMMIFKEGITYQWNWWTNDGNDGDAVVLGDDKDDDDDNYNDEDDDDKEKHRFKSKSP